MINIHVQITLHGPEAANAKIQGYLGAYRQVYALALDGGIKQTMTWRGYFSKKVEYVATCVSLQIQNERQ